MQNRVAKRKRWTTRIWKISMKGNPNKKSWGLRGTIYSRGGGWVATLLLLMVQGVYMIGATILPSN